MTKPSQHTCSSCTQPAVKSITGVLVLDEDKLIARASQPVRYYCQTCWNRLWTTLPPEAASNVDEAK